MIRARLEKEKRDVKIQRWKEGPRAPPAKNAAWGDLERILGGERPRVTPKGKILTMEVEEGGGV